MYERRGSGFKCRLPLTAIGAAAGHEFLWGVFLAKPFGVSDAILLFKSLCCSVRCPQRKSVPIFVPAFLCS